MGVLSVSGLKRVRIGIIAVFIISILVISGCNKEIDYESTRLPKSPYHHTNGTWWGYNKVKVVRHEDIVYTYYINNENLSAGDPNKDNPSEVVMMRINQDLSVEEFDYLFCILGN